MQEVPLRDAKARFSAVVGAAEQGEPTVVPRHGTPVAVVVGHAEWQRLTGARPSFSWPSPRMRTTASGGTRPRSAALGHDARIPARHQPRPGHRA